MDWNVRAVKITTRKATFFQRKIEARLLNHFSHGKAIKVHILSVRLQPYLFSTQSSCALLHCHLWSVRIYGSFLQYLIKATIVEKIVTEYAMRVLVFSTKLSERLLILKRTEWDIIITIQRLLLSDCNETWIFSTDFRKIFEYQF
jgi:hypothetical protein